MLRESIMFHVYQEVTYRLLGDLDGNHSAKREKVTGTQVERVCREIQNLMNCIYELCLVDSNVLFSMITNNHTWRMKLLDLQLELNKSHEQLQELMPLISSVIEGVANAEKQTSHPHHPHQQGQSDS